MPSKVTVTGVVGPGITATATVIQNVNAFSVNCDTQLLRVVSNNQNNIQDFDITGKSTVTVTLSGGVWTVSIS